MRSILRPAAKNQPRVLFRRTMSTCQQELGPSRYLNIPNYGRIHVRESGPADAAPLIFIPAAMTNGDFWRKVVPSFSDKYRCICPDLPNGGHSTPLDPGADLSPTGLADLIKLIIENTTPADRPPVIIANNTGGALTQIMISRHPNIVSKVVLTNCDVKENYLPKLFMPLVWGARSLPSLTASILRKVSQSPTLVNSPLLLGWLCKHPVDWQVWMNYVNGMINNQGVMDDFIRFAAGVDNRHTIAAAQTFHNFDKPVLLAWANEAPIFEPKWATELNGLFPNSEIAWIPNSYALVPEDNPTDLSQAIRTFLEK